MPRAKPLAVAPEARTLAQLRQECVKKQDVWISLHLYTYLSIPVVWLLLRTPITPNMVTWSSGILGLAGTVGIANPWADPWMRLLGVLLLQFAVVLDHVDGQLARAKNLRSPGGLFLDNFFFEIFLHLALSIAIPLVVFWDTRDERWLLAAAAFAALKALNLAPFHMRSTMTVKQPSAAMPPGHSVRPGRPWRSRIAERWWDVKKMTNVATLLIPVDFALNRFGWGDWAVAEVPLTLVGIYVALGIPILAGATLVGVIQGGRGRFHVDLEPYR